MTADKIKNRLSEMCTHMTFSFAGKDCGVDPLSHSHFDMWFGDDTLSANSIDEVMSAPLFDGKALEDIATSIDIIDW